MTLDLTTLEASLRRDEELAAQLKAGYHGFSREGVASALLDRVKDCRELLAMLKARDADLASEVRVNVAQNEELEQTESSLAEAIRALAVAHGRLLDADICPECGTHELFTGSNDACDTCGAHLEPYRAVLSSFQPRKDTP